jgi:GTPase SAR1 family protein
MASDDENVDEYVYKILVVGDLGSGKTSFIHRYVNGTFSSTYRATISFSLHYHSPLLKVNPHVFTYIVRKGLSWEMLIFVCV